MYEDQLKTRSAEAEQRFPPEGEILPVRNWNMHYLQKGSGQDVLLIHGAGGSTRDMSFRLMERLTPFFRVTSIDRPGHGYTTSAEPNSVITPIQQAELVWEFCRIMGIRNPIVMGQSFGGAVALAMALQEPGRAKGYCLVAAASTSAIPVLGLNRIDIMQRLNDILAKPAVSHIAPRILSPMIAKIFHPNPVPEGYAEHFGPQMSIRYETYIHNSRQIASLGPTLRVMMKSYHAIRDNVIFVHGDQDSVLSLEKHAMVAKSFIPGARLRILKGQGHMPHQTATFDVVSAIRELKS